MQQSHATRPLDKGVAPQLADKKAKRLVFRRLQICAGMVPTSVVLSKEASSDVVKQTIRMIVREPHGTNRTKVKC